MSGGVSNLRLSELRYDLFEGERLAEMKYLMPSRGFGLVTYNVCCPYVAGGKSGECRWWIEFPSMSPEFGLVNAERIESEWAYHNPLPSRKEMGVGRRQEFISYSIVGGPLPSFSMSADGNFNLKTRERIPANNADKFFERLEEIDEDYMPRLESVDDDECDDEEDGDESACIQVRAKL
ncbi:hypothetical protein R3P38DRAFT_3201687 [Favolaschia claudopus]|uniref:Uncharacterized protein n=1 Tax=Favolaschia claudopus TaxID=2862362 RepID=A0AAW0AUV3_9AGAR